MRPTPTRPIGRMPGGPRSAATAHPDADPGDVPGFGFGIDAGEVEPRELRRRLVHRGRWDATAGVPMDLLAILGRLPPKVG